MGIGNMTLRRVEGDEEYTRCDHCLKRGKWVLLFAALNIFLCDECRELLKALLNATEDEDAK